MHEGSQRRTEHVLFSASVLLSAFLLFEIQPMVGKLLLPRFGGSASVWMGCMLFFQAALLLAYAYADSVVQKTAGALQLALASAPFLAAATFPLLGASGVGPERSESGPPLWLLIETLLAHAGLPFFALATTAPLLQHWYARTLQRSPYPLYAASNIGSLAGLLAYPFAIEPLLSMRQQQTAFAFGVGLATFAVMLCALALQARLRERANSRVEGALVPQREGAVDAGSRLAQRNPPSGMNVRAACRVAALAAVPSAMLLTVTNHLTLDVAPVPLLWVLPLALYLTAFALAFGSTRARRSRFGLLLFVGSSVLLSGSLALGARSAFVVQVGSALATHFGACLLTLTELFHARPSDALASRFYLAVAFGGVVGAALVALVAPLAVNQACELPLCIAATYVIILAQRPQARWMRSRLLAGFTWLGIGASLPLLTAPLFWRDAQTELLEQTRSFYGTLSITRDAEAVRLSHGRILHGMQFQDPERALLPNLYFGPDSGVGLVLRRHRLDRPRTIGVVGLGVGTLASYARPGDRFDFYELDPNVVGAAQRHFSFLKTSRAQVELHTGDGRLLLEREPSPRFDVLVLDAFASDAVPVHLLTVEAFGTYVRRLTSDGVLVANVINRHIDLDRVVAGSARAQGLAISIVDTPRDAERGLSHARWAVMAVRAATLAQLTRGQRQGALSGKPVRFTDDFSNIATVLHGLRGLY